VRITAYLLVCDERFFGEDVHGASSESEEGKRGSLQLT
jgi:hypothetical protein